jgi:hypothetical protein
VKEPEKRVESTREREEGCRSGEKSRHRRRDRLSHVPQRRMRCLLLFPAEQPGKRESLRCSHA